MNSETELARFTQRYPKGIYLIFATEMRGALHMAWALLFSLYIPKLFIVQMYI